MYHDTQINDTMYEALPFMCVTFHMLYVLNQKQLSIYTTRISLHDLVELCSTSNFQLVFPVYFPLVFKNSSFY